MPQRENIRLSIVVPLYNEEEVIAETYKRLSHVMEQQPDTYELLFVNDGSRDRTGEIVTEICKWDSSVRLIDFSRNFGHQVAISAGMDYALGDAVIVIDADLQDPPEVILQMIEKWHEGYDVVYGKRIKRKGETLFKKTSAKLFYRLLRSMTNVDIPVDAGDFRLIDRQVCNVLKGLKEKNRYIRGLVSWAGFRQTSVEYVREERFAGETKYPFRKMMKFALDGITSFSYKPLRVATYLGMTVSVVSFLYLIVVIFQKIFTDTTETGWASTVAILLFFNGIMLMLMGIIGEYIGRIYDETKGRPLYIVREELGYRQMPNLDGEAVEADGGENGSGTRRVARTEEEDRYRRSSGEYVKRGDQPTRMAPPDPEAIRRARMASLVDKLPKDRMMTYERAVENPRVPSDNEHPASVQQPSLAGVYGQDDHSEGSS